MLLDAIAWVLEEIPYVWYGKIAKQCQGIPAGIGPGPAITNLFLGEKERDFLHTPMVALFIGKNAMLIRYLDDIIGININLDKMVHMAYKLKS